MAIMKKKILLVDDSGFIRKILKDFLQSTYNIVEAATGNEAVEQFKKEQPDLTLLDIIMSDGEDAGIIALEKIIKLDSQAKIIMLSAIEQNNTLNKCKKLGAVDYIIKPFDSEMVAEAIKKYLI